MTTRFARRTVAIVAAASAAALLTGCGAGQTPFTSRVKAAVQGLNLDKGSVRVLNAALVLDESVPAGAASASLHLQAVILNTGALADTLESVAVASAAKVTVADGSKIALPSNKPISISAAGTTVAVTDVAPAPHAGSYVPVVLTFALAGELSVSLPVNTSVAE